MMRFKIPGMQLISLLAILLILACEMSTEVDDPFAGQQLSEVTIAHIFEERRQIIPGRWETVVRIVDTTYTGNVATLVQKNGQLVVEMQSTLSTNETINVKITGGFEGERFLGAYPVVPYHPDSLFRKNKFTVQMERIIEPGIVQPPYEGGHRIDKTVKLSYFSGVGDFQVYVYRPEIRLQVNVAFKSAMDTTAVNKEIFKELGFKSVPKTVRVELAFNALPQ